MSRSHNPSKPAAGHYTVRLCPKGWGVPAKVEVIDGQYFLTIDGDRYEPFTEDDLALRVARWLTAEYVDRVTQLLMRGMPCSEAIYNHRNALREHYRQHDPDHPSVNPGKPIDTRFIRPEDF